MLKPSVFSYDFSSDGMKDIINYYYNLNIQAVEDWDNLFTFTWNNNLFYLVPFNRSQKELRELLEINQELKQKGLQTHDLIANKFGKILTNIYEVNYVLLKIVNDQDEKYDLKDMKNITEKLVLNTNKSYLYRNIWSELWSKKIDYLECQVHELGKDKKIILDSFSYYVGLGENAINYVNNNRYQKGACDYVTLSHRRISYPNIKLNYLNPLSFIFDLEVRDVAEYIKSAFFYEAEALSYLKEALKIYFFSPYSLTLLYARLLYPSYYFDLYEKVMNNQLEEESLIPIIEKAEAYEQFLKDAYIEISKYASIDNVFWILKEL